MSHGIDPSEHWEQQHVVALEARIRELEQKNRQREAHIVELEKLVLVVNQQLAVAREALEFFAGFAANALIRETARTALAKLEGGVP